MLRFLFILPLLLISACAYVTDGAIQDVTVLTPGANNAECKLSLGSVDYLFNPPMTRSVQKTGENMVIDCMAPGNRQKTVHIKPMTSATTFYNAPAGLVPGFAWDYASNSVFQYPKVVEVDFTQTQIKPFPLPAQNQPDIPAPESYDLEEFSPGMPRLNSDRFATKPEIRRREVPESFDLQGFAGREGDAQASDLGSDGGEGGASKVRVIGRANEGIAVPTPPSPAEQAAAAAARSAERSSSQPQTTEGTAQNGGLADPNAPAAPAAESTPGTTEGEGENPNQNGTPESLIPNN